MSKKSFTWLFTVLLGIPVLFILFVTFSYDVSAKLDEFPVPKGAQVAGETGSSMTFTWGRASGDEGIPFSYEMKIKFAGWEETNREGAWVSYQNGETTIDLITDSDYLYLALGEDEAD
ncbi:hypothetical protein [Jeotgalibacillus proteolyticus]|uniref:Uncharacterized protein n=1 Tax=Jeotgalibacillus proteolyticus TaxID=2082395 RepID=A0A2S5G7Y1_9BACL|nr:hypothetical protein [Jeotgalibacillus proteolyticus]PPA69090.1 hypothetical protein C4B60_17405 [Jeotgalibacillus proteolyticus]